MNKIYNGVASEYDFPKYENKMPLKVHPETIIGIDELLKEKDKEIDRLNNIINRIGSFVDRTIEVIKQQPSGNDEWILERLNGIKYLIELKEDNNV